MFTENFISFFSLSVITYLEYWHSLYISVLFVTVLQLNIIIFLP